MCFASLPLVYDYLRGVFDESIAIIVSPFKRADARPSCLSSPTMERLPFMLAVSVSQTITVACQLRGQMATAQSHASLKPLQRMVGIICK